jgi:hypothetical protein
MFWRPIAYPCRCIGVGAGIDGAIYVIVLGDRDPLGSGELLFQMTGVVFSFSQARAVARLCVRALSRVLCAAAMAVMRASCSRCMVAVVA